MRAGGGPRTAAKRGASVRLIEGHRFLGAMGTAGLVPGFSEFTDGVNSLADGVGREIIDAFQAAGGGPARHSP